MALSWLMDFFKRRNDPSQGLPCGLTEALRCWKFEMHSNILREWCIVQKDSDKSLKQLLNYARESGWTDAGIEKLDILYEYYAGDTVKAFERASQFLSDPDLLIICTVALYQNNQFEDAYKILHQQGITDVLKNRPDYWLIRAIVCWAVNEMEELRQAVYRMCELSPNDPVILENACAMLFELGDLDQFEEIRARFDAAYEPGYARALLALAHNDYVTGFKWAEARYEMHDVTRYFNKGLRNEQRWRGEPLTGKNLLISSEQGLGDTVQMARYFSQLKCLGAEKVFVETQQEALTLLKFNFPEIFLFAQELDRLGSDCFDYWLGSMSLPYVFGTTSESVPFRGGYLKVPPESKIYWQKRVKEISSSGCPKIGLAWSGNPAHRGDRRRSLPFKLLMNEIRGVNAVFFALQTQVPSVVPANLADLSEEVLTLADTAALIDEMDLVITVDTSVVHIAGALGKTTFLLLPYRYEWRWGMVTEKNNWYDSVSVLRQRRHGDWGTLLNDVFRKRVIQYFDEPKV